MQQLLPHSLLLTLFSDEYEHVSHAQASSVALLSLQQ